MFSKIVVTMKQTCDVKDLTMPHQARLVVVLKFKRNRARGKRFCFEKIAVTMKQTCDIKDLTTPHQPRLVVVLKMK